jgi:hypothetical protein
LLHLRKVLCHGVVQKGGRGAPKCIIQEEVKDRNKQIAVRGTVKAAHLQGDDVVKCLLASSVYDTKPVHYLTGFRLRRQHWRQFWSHFFNSFPAISIFARMFY